MTTAKGVFTSVVPKTLPAARDKRQSDDQRIDEEVPTLPFPFSIPAVYFYLQFTSHHIGPLFFLFAVPVLFQFTLHPPLFILFAVAVSFSVYFRCTHYLQPLPFFPILNSSFIFIWHDRHYWPPSIFSPFPLFIWLFLNIKIKSSST